MKNPIKALLADDHGLVRTGIKGHLQKNSEGVEFEFMEASDSDQTMELVSLHAFDIVILDYNFPTLGGGAKTLKLIRKIRPNLPVLVLSGYSESTYVKQMIKAGASGYVIKDVPADTLVDAIRTVIGKQPYYSNAIAIELLKEKSGNDPSQPTLTKREITVLELVAQGLTSKEIADKLYLSFKTINTHRQHINKKLGFKKGIDFTKALPLLINNRQLEP